MTVLGCLEFCDEKGSEAVSGSLGKQAAYGPGAAYVLVMALRGLPAPAGHGPGLTKQSRMRWSEKSEKR